MDKDALTAGVLHGGVFGTAEIKILICYILSSVSEPVPVSLLANTLHYEGIANGFEVSDAIVSLDKNGQIVSCDEKSETYTVTENGKNVANTLKSSLSIIARDRALKATIKMLSHMKNVRDTEFEIVEENGQKFIICSCVDDGKPFMSIKLLVTDDTQAQIIKEKFLENPAGVYAGVIELITK